MELSYQDVANILKIVEGSAVDELHVELGGLSLTIRRSGRPARPPMADRA